MDPVDELLARDQYGIKFGLEGIRTLCDALDHPERSWTSLIVAGTNGKGSVTAMIAAALTAAGYRTGRYTSPHLVGIEERIAVDGRPVARQALAEAAAVVLDHEARCLASGRLPAPLTFFEITTATAFETFRRQGARIVVLEVGMGGRLDATNAADPVGVAITSIALDHTRFLGETLAEIAFEKAGVIRAGRPVVIGPMPDEAAETIRRVAGERRASLVEALTGVSLDTCLTPDGRTRLALRTPGDDYGQVTLALRGRHQVTNAVVAVRLLEAARDHGVGLSRLHIRQGLADAVWPARLEHVALGGGRSVLLDAAHNTAGAQALADYLADGGWPPVPLVFGAMRDKDVGGMLSVLAPHVSRLFLTQAHSPRAMPADALAAEASRLGLGVAFVAVANPRAALDAALATSPFVVVAGSIFLIGDLLPCLRPPSARHGG